MLEAVPTKDDVDVPMMPNQAQEPANCTGALPEDRCDVPTQEDETVKPMDKLGTMKNNLNVLI